MPILELSPDQLLTTTRSVRRRLDMGRPVSLDLVRECLEIALQAPSGSNRQSWYWIVVTDADLRNEIGNFYKRAFDAYGESSEAAGRLFADDPIRAAVQERVGSSAAWLAERMKDVPVLVIAGRRVVQMPTGSQASMWGSVLPAAWSYMLAARARGLGTAWTTLHLDYEQEIAALLNVPDDVRQGALIPTAYYTGDTFHPAPRQPLDTVLHLNRG